METPLCRLEGIIYWVIEDPNGIYDFINKEIRREWEEDARFECRDPKQDRWLRTLAKRKWRLEVMDLSRIKMNPDIMNYIVQKRNYIFLESLDRRKNEPEIGVKRYAIVIWLLVIRQGDIILIDGFGRYSMLQEINVSKTYV